MKEGLKYVTENPGTFLKNFLVKSAHFWAFPKINPEQSPPIRRIFYWIFFPLSLFGFALAGTKKLERSLFALSPVAFWLLYSITFVLPRYRIPVEPEIFVFAAVGIDYLLTKRKRRDENIGY